DEKTINLKLKEDKKQGYFGNVSGGYGTEERYEGKFNVNRFGKKMQFSALGAANNNNQQGFSFEDYINLMGGLSNFMSAGSGNGRMRIEINPSESGIPMARSTDRGFTDTQAGGLNLNYDFSPKTELSGNYFFNRIQNDLDRLATRQNLLGAGNFDSEEVELRNSGNMNHRLNLTLRHKLDSFQNIIARAKFNYNDASLLSQLGGSTFDAAQIIQNNSLRNYDSDGQVLRGEAGLVYRRRFGRKGRAFVADLSYRNSGDSRKAYLLADNTFYPNGQATTSSVRQRQQYSDDAENYGISLSYTEPIGKRQYFEWQASRQQYTNRTNKNFYDLIETPTPGEVFNPLLSNQFKRGYRYDRAGMNYLRNRKKYNLTAGAALQNSVLDGTLAGSSENLSRSFTRVLPALFYNYEMGVGRNFSVEYTTNLREPSLEQLQPVVDNSDPLNT
ncbi:MAG: outer membrane beta-barrel protein, partial [Saprospiraceae bacterium]|nr:outer membrane beta-barrel protein [Saprospiraceae bacterium]